MSDEPEKKPEPQGPPPNLIVAEFEVRARFDNDPSFLATKIEAGQQFRVSLNAPLNPNVPTQFIHFKAPNGKEFRLFLRFAPRKLEPNATEDKPNT
jgi:hypothetical protein